MMLTGRAGLLAVAGALVVGLLLPSWRGIALVEGMLALGVLADLVLAGSPRSLRLDRHGDAAVRLGEAATVRLSVHNTGNRPVRGILRDAWVPSAGASPERQPIDVPAGERRQLTTDLRPTRRGDRPAVRVTIRSLGPLGLAARQTWLTVPWSIRVLPSFASRRHLPSRLARLRQLDGRTLALVRGQGTEFDSLRDYVDGDDVRSIDWRATARRDGMVVRTWRPERDRHVLLVLDTSRTSAGRVGDAPRLDAAMDAVLLLTALATRAGDRVDLLAYDRRVRASVQGQHRVGATRVLATMVEALATIEPELVELDARGLVPAVLARTTERSLVVLLTSLDTAAAEEGLLTVLGPLTRRHQLVVASVADPRVAEMTAGRGDAIAVYEAAAAERTRTERRTVTERLARHGVEVIDAPPDELPPKLADGYLALKAAGRL